ncbi:MAG: hypothetical protein WC005_05845 [Candidatus Nanopelagicales bacterium]
MSDWKNLAEHLVSARVSLGFSMRSEFIRAKGITHDRVLNDLENARRDNYNPATLVQVEQWYGLAQGNIKEILEGRPARYADQTVSAVDQAMARVRLNLPDAAVQGLSDAEQEEVRATAIAAALQRAREIRGSSSANQAKA